MFESFKYIFNFKKMIPRLRLLIVISILYPCYFGMIMDNFESNMLYSCETQSSFRDNKECKALENKLQQRLGNSRSGPDLIRSHGYPLEQHHVTSEDGYVTTLFRIPYSRFENRYSPREGRKVVLFHHGFIEDGFSWILNSIDKALAYRLSDLGNVDVWMTNNRGTYYSLEHTRYSWPSRHYWNFSFDEIGQYDVPKIIDYVLEESGSEDLYYIAHSMGASAFMSCMSLFPEYNAKIRTFVGLAPAVFVGNTTTPFERVIPYVLRQQEIFDDLMKLPFIKPALIPFMDIFGTICSNRVSASWICFAALETVFGYDFTENNYEMGPDIFSNGLSSASMKSLFHLLQIWKSAKFQRYDYGKRNRAAYGTRLPPKYELWKVTSPVVLNCGQHDNLVSCIDVEELANQLPNAKEFRTIVWKKFNHIDFMFAKDINPLVNDRIVEIVKYDLFAPIKRRR